MAMLALLMLGVGYGVAQAAEYTAGNVTDLGTAITSAITPGDKIKLTSDIDNSAAAATYILSHSGVILDGDGHSFGGGTTALRPFTIPQFSKNITIENMIFKGNISTHGTGGALSTTRDNEGIILRNVIFEGNIAQPSSHGAAVGGGAFYIDQGTQHDFTGTQFINNSTGPTWGHGGAVYFSAGTDMNFTDTLFRGNSAAVSGGAMYIQGALATPTLLNFTRATFENNTANGAGGALNVYLGSEINFTEAKFIENKTLGAAAAGGAVMLSRSSNINFTDSQFIRNTAGTHGGAVAAVDGSRNLNFTRAKFEGNISTAEGGAVIFWNGSDANFTDAQFIDNLSQNYDGGAVNLLNSSDINFTGAQFLRNKAEGSSLVSGSARGGGVAIRNSTNVKLNNALFQGNTSDGDGGAVSLARTAANVDFTGATFDGNTASGSGGALLIEQSVTNVTLNDVTFTDNTTGRGEGGAIHTEADITIGGNSTFSGNKTVRSGGAVSLSAANLTLDPAAGKTVEFVTMTDTVKGTGNMFKSGKGTAKFGGNVALVGNIEVREGDMIVADGAFINSKDFLLKRDATLGLTLSGLNNAIIRLDSGKGVMETGSNFKAKLTGDAAALQVGQSVDVAVLKGATGSNAADFDPTIAIDNMLYTASGKFANDTWYVTLTRRSIIDPIPPDPTDPPVPPIPPIPPDIGGSVDDDYTPGDNPWLDDVLEGKPEDLARTILSGVNLPAMVQTFFILQDISGVMRNASFQGPEWARRNGGKVFGDERGSLWAAPFYLNDQARNMPTRYRLKAGYNLHLGGGIAGINRNAADNTASFGGLVSLGAGRLTSSGDFLRTSNTTQFFASSVYGEWRPAAMKGALRLGMRGGITSTENSVYQAGPAPLRAEIYARAWQLDLYAEHRKVWDDWEIRTSVGAGAVWYYRPSFTAKAANRRTTATSSDLVDVAEYGQSRELTVRIPVRLTASRRIVTKSSGTFTPEAYIGYQPVLGDRSEDYTWKLMNGSHPVKVYGPQLDRHSATAGASLVWQNDNIRASLTYDGEFSRHRRNHAVGVSFGWEF